MSAKMSFRCQSCGERNVARFDRAGLPMLCAQCGVLITVPIPPDPAGGGGGKRVKFACSHCGHRHRVAVARVGEIISCESCGQKLRVPPRLSKRDLIPTAAAPASPPPSEPAAPLAPQLAFEPSATSADLVPLSSPQLRPFSVPKPGPPAPPAGKPTPKEIFELESAPAVPAVSALDPAPHRALDLEDSVLLPPVITAGDSAPARGATSRKKKTRRKT